MWFINVPDFQINPITPDFNPDDDDYDDDVKRKRTLRLHIPKIPESIVYIISGKSG
jgi:hypothetical protein